MKTFPCCASLLIFALFTGVGFSQDQSDQPTKRAAFIKKFDKDGDGKLSETERAAAKKAAAKRGNKGQPGDTRRPSPDRQALLKKFDKDGDGKLNQAEQTALRNAMQKKRGSVEKGPGQGRPNNFWLNTTPMVMENWTPKSVRRSKSQHRVPERNATNKPIKNVRKDYCNVSTRTATENSAQQNVGP